MSSSTSGPGDRPSQGLWNSMVSYFTPPVAAGVAIVPAYRDFAAKSDLQRGMQVTPLSYRNWFKGGVEAARPVGVLVGAQMVVQPVVERALNGESNHSGVWSTFASSGIVGGLSSPFVAVFNGNTMGWDWKKSLRNFTPKQAAVITVQETAFVGGLSAADKVSSFMRGIFGDNKAVDYASTFTAGALGSLAGHPANTALTRAQSGLPFDARQCMSGGATKARGVGVFAVCYKLMKETFGSLSQES